ncbi:putative Mg(2+) transport ATPase [Candidatus Izimaplasma bacterium HR1]|uniref:MgtC/SapB family protein n=1 Tax=Candidatus Izimoplasma sp. HR1 TaxID=1541959 RepID=UPI0004F8852F|nr:putative Mg(2+) transport ATPase [Candidatus Izimaplasma bacterium HR1]
MDKTIDILYILQSLGLTLLFVGLIGYERQKKHKIAGMTTHLLVAFGAAALAIVQEYMVIDSLAFLGENPEYMQAVVVQRQRIVAQIIAGVGFLGTGAIIKTNGYITGLTTASTLWISSIIGIIFGLGYTTLGIIVSMLTLVTLIIVKRVFKQQFDSQQ